jgi:hypothetical protein
MLNITNTVKGRYMMYTNALDCITLKQVRFEIILLPPLILFDDSNLYSNLCRNFQVISQPYESDEVEAMNLNPICKRYQEV